MVALFSYLVYSILGMSSAFAATLVIGMTSALNFVVLRTWAFTHHEPVTLMGLRPIAHE
jgi:hypothetical protein